MKRVILPLLLFVFSFAQGQTTCDINSIYDNESTNAVCIDTAGAVRYIYSNNYPDHSDDYHQPQFTVTAGDYDYYVCANPDTSSSFTPLYEETETSVGCTYTYTFGVSINGVKYDPSSAVTFENTSTGENNLDWHVEATSTANNIGVNMGTLNGGHLNPFGEYHYHAVPTDYFVNDLGIDGSAHSPIIGYAADGFPVYYKYVYEDAQSGGSVAAFSSGYSLRSGSRPGDGVSAPDGTYDGNYYEDYEYSSTDLDECNGRYAITPDYPYGTYYYVITDNYPYIPRCFKGTYVDHSFRVGPGPSCPSSTASTSCAASVYGCMDPFSTNYNASANVDDGSCTYDDVNQWTGTVSSNWNVSGNWEDGTVPTASDDVLISSTASNQPRVTLDVSTPAVCRDLTIQSGAILTINAGKGLTVSGDVDNQGTLLVKANAAAIGSFLNTGSLSGGGSYQMEQYLSGSGGSTPDGIFYYVGSPVVGADVETYDIASGNKVWTADESSQSYIQQTVGSTVLEAAKGYAVRMGVTGDVTFDGTSFNTGAQSATGLTRTGITESNRGYNLVSNPYPSTIDWNELSKTNLSNSIWFRTNQGGTMTFDTYNGTANTGTNNNGNGDVTSLIPPTQAFWVRVDSDGNIGQLDFDNADRSHGSWSSIYRLAAEEGTVRMALSDGTLSDETIIHFNTDANNGVDDFDSPKFWAHGIPQLYTTVGTDSLVINGYESTTSMPVVDLGIEIPENGNYTLVTNDITLSENVLLEDRVLGIFQDLNVEPQYSFTSDAGNFPTRFALHFGMSITDIHSNMDDLVAEVFSSGNVLNIRLAAGIENGTVTIYDMAGKRIATKNIIADRTTIPVNAATGTYIVKFESDKGTSTHKIHLQ